jgi:hypothetical protein
VSPKIGIFRQGDLDSKRKNGPKYLMPLSCDLFKKNVKIKISIRSTMKEHREKEKNVEFRFFHFCAVKHCKEMIKTPLISRKIKKLNSLKLLSPMGKNCMREKKFPNWELLKVFKFPRSEILH